MRLALGIAVALLMSVQVCNAQEKPVIIALVGDSTVEDKSGWGAAFAERFNDNAKVYNFAVGGRSSKSWYHEQRLARVLKVKPDYVFIQFGHNDQPGKGPARETDPATTYRDYLKLYLKEFRKIGAKPIILSSVTRRTFDENGKIKASLTPWAKAAQAVAKEMKVPFIDLHSASIEYHNRIGIEASMTLNYKKGDGTHFNEKGANAITDLILKELKTVVPELAAYLQ